MRSTEEVEIPQWDEELRTLVALGTGQIGIDQFESFLTRDRHAWIATETWALWRAESAAKHRALKSARDATFQKTAEGTQARLDGQIITSAWAEERKAQAIYLRCIFGNPFRPVAVNPAWLAWGDRTVPRIARAICNERAFDLMPILADALEDAGCTDPILLDHCRQPGEHVRGCWVVDLLMGRE